MRDKFLSDLISLTDKMAMELSGNSPERMTAAERDKLLKTWNIMRQTAGADPSDGDRPMGEAFNSYSREQQPESEGNVVSLFSNLH